MRAHAKINAFLKIVGVRGDYHELNSRFILVEDLWDEIDFVEREDSSNLIIGCDIADNIVEKAYRELSNLGFERELADFFGDRQIRLIKRIPSGAGLGGGSSDAAAFLRLANEQIGLNLSASDLAKVAQNIGADVAFFVSGAKAANVSGIGEVVEPFADDVPPLEIIASEVFCSTPAVYRKFRSDYFKFDLPLARALSQKTTREILANYENAALNDLLAPCLALYSNLKIARDEFLSGSGSAKFKVK